MCLMFMVAMFWSISSCILLLCSSWILIEKRGSNPHLLEINLKFLKEIILTKEIIILIYHPKEGQEAWVL